jgi:aromatase
VADKIHAQRHTITAAASAHTLYGIIADALSWPVVLGPTIHVERLTGDDHEETLQLWATANGEVRTWTSRRTLDPDRLRVTFQQERSPAPLTAMGGAWSLEQTGPGSTQMILDHTFSVAGDDPEAARWFATAVDKNSTTELAAMKELVEGLDARTALTLSFTDSVEVTAGAAAIYEFLWDAHRWPQRIPHVAGLEVTEPLPQVQVMSMETSTTDGGKHTTRSVRVGFPGRRIVYKQIETPALMRVHTGEWLLAEGDGTTLASSTHTVVINTENIAEVLGSDATVEDAKKFVQQALSHNSSTTLRYAKAHAESAASALSGGRG